jgi:hypothetical protein
MCVNLKGRSLTHRSFLTSVFSRLSDKYKVAIINITKREVS